MLVINLIKKTTFYGIEDKNCGTIMGKHNVMYMTFIPNYHTVMDTRQYILDYFHRCSINRMEITRTDAAPAQTE